ncbi:MAG: carboxypeptidase-like regulatory domain-containing protein, partial [Bacteroidales bacterium]
MTIAKKMSCLFLLLTVMGAKGQNAKIEITGIVKDSLTKEPLTGVYITTGKQGAQTDYDGKYTIRDLTEGEVTLSTMYFSSYPVKQKTIYLTQDTII